MAHSAIGFVVFKFINSRDHCSTSLRPREMTTRCLGWVKSKDRRCTKKGPIDGYCQFHVPRSKCVIKTKKGRQCHTPGELDNCGRCHIHAAYALSDAAMCNGQIKAGKKCRREKQEGKDYCQPKHDPSYQLIERECIEVYNLRREREEAIADRDNNKDGYTGLPIDKTDRGTIQLDHIWEIQAVIGVCYRAMGAAESIPDHVMKSLSDIINNDANLCLTTAKINKAKGAAFKTFLDKYLMDVEVMSLEHYLRETFEREECSELIPRVLEQIGEAAAFIEQHLSETKANLDEEVKRKRYRNVLEEFRRMVKTMEVSMATVKDENSNSNISATPPSSPARATSTKLTMSPKTKSKAKKSIQKRL